MEAKSMVHMMCWFVIDGLAAIWVLDLIMGLAANEKMIEALELMSRALSG